LKLERLWKLLKKHKRILIVNPFGIGDCLFITPLLRALKEQGSAERIILLLGSRTNEVFKENPYVSKTIPIDRGWFRKQKFFSKLGFVWNLVKELRKEKLDTFFDFSLSREYGFIALFFLWIPMRIGFNYKKRGLFLNRRFDLSEGYQKKHVIEYYCELLKALNIKPTSQEMNLFLSELEKSEAKKILNAEGIIDEPYIVVAPGGGDSWGKDAYLKQWPSQYFKQLTNLLKDQLPVTKIILLGSPSEQELTKDFSIDSKFEVINWVGQRTLRESFSIISGAYMVFANDGGITHVTRALGTPLISLYGPVNPVVYGPYPSSDQTLVVYGKDLSCQPCYGKFRYQSDCETGACLKELMPEDAAERIKQSGILENIKTRKCENNV